MQCGYKDGSDRIHLRLPILLTHEIDSKSPLRNWLEEGGLDKDANSEIVVVINAYKFTNGQNMLRQRTYNIRNHVKYGYKFVPIVKHPLMSVDRKPRVRWQHFHDISKSEEMGDFPSPPQTKREQHILPDLKFYGLNSMGGNVKGLERYVNKVGKSTTITGENLQRFVRYFSDANSDAGNSLPPPLALHPALPGMDRFREVDERIQDDLTVGASDLHRYSAAVGTDTLPALSQPSFTPLPADFREMAAEAQLNAIEEGKKSNALSQDGSNLVMAPRSMFADDEDAGPIHLEYVFKNNDSEKKIHKYITIVILFCAGTEKVKTGAWQPLQAC